MENRYSHETTKDSGKIKFKGSIPIELKRAFNVPVEQLWKAWSTAEFIQQWYYPKGFTCPDAKVDFREGGKFVIACLYPDGKTQEWSGGEYLEIVPYEKIVCSDYFTDEAGSKVLPSTYGHEGEWPSECYVTVTFESLDDEHCRMTLVHEGVPKDQHADCVQGWSQSIDKLQNLVERH